MRSLIIVTEMRILTESEPSFKGLYTLLIALLNKTTSNGGGNLYYPEEFATFSAEEIRKRTANSKLLVVSEQVSH